MQQTIRAGFLALVWTASAQQPVYLHTSLPAERRATDLAGRKGPVWLAASMPSTDGSPFVSY